MSNPIIQAYFPKSHPIEDLQKDKNESNVFRSSNNLWASYEIIDGLTLKENVSYDYIANKSLTYWPMDSNNGSDLGGLGSNYILNQNNIYSSTTLNYVKSFNQKHNLDVLVGWDVDDRRIEYVMASQNGYPHNKLPESINAATPMEGMAYYEQDHLLSLLSRVNYDFDNKILCISQFPSRWKLTFRCK